MCAPASLRPRSPFVESECVSVCVWACIVIPGPSGDGGGGFRGWLEIVSASVGARTDRAKSLTHQVARSKSIENAEDGRISG